MLINPEDKHSVHIEHTTMRKNVEDICKLTFNYYSQIIIHGKTTAKLIPRTVGLARLTGMELFYKKAKGQGSVGS